MSKLVYVLTIALVCIVGYLYTSLPLETFKTIVKFFFYGLGMYVVSFLLASLIYD